MIFLDISTIIPTTHYESRRRYRNRSTGGGSSCIRNAIMDVYNIEQGVGNLCPNLMNQNRYDGSRINIICTIHPLL
jgi:hypothetical protein